VITERKRRFVTAYMKLANANKAAIEAGYSERTARTQGPRLLRDVDVQELIQAQRIRKDVHADLTYQKLIQISDLAVANASQVWQDPNATRSQRQSAIECAGKQLERLARVEGILVPAPIMNVGELNVQNNRATVEMLGDGYERILKDDEFKGLITRFLDAGRDLEPPKAPVGLPGAPGEVLQRGDVGPVQAPAPDQREAPGRDGGQDQAPHDPDAAPAREERIDEPVLPGLGPAEESEPEDHPG
jgi:phage terminase small subunit